MPYDDPDPQDPMMLVGVELPGDRAAQLEMARCFAEEYARMGFGEAQILDLFRRPFYADAHRAFLGLGEDLVTRLVRENVAAWGRVRIVDREDHDE